MSIRSILVCAALAAAMLAGVSPAGAQGSWSPYDETATSALGRYVRDLTTDPKNFNTLIAAGRAALAIGDTQAAAGFFARADEVQPRSWKPQAGMAAVHVADDEPQASLAYFTRAQQLGATLADIGVDRGLAYDLLGRQADAQKDYTAALNGADRDTAAARLALSLAISGRSADALAALAPLQAKGDPAGTRARAFVLALSGDSTGARRAIDAVMPGSSASVAPLLTQLPRLAAAQKAAAVNLGMFPDSGQNGYSVASLSLPPMPLPQTLAPAAAMPQSSPPSIARPTAPSAAPVMRQASAPAPSPQRATATGKKIWLQLASGADRGALDGQFAKIKSRHRDLLDGINGYVAQSNDRARLLIGPFRSASDADTFASDLESVDVSAFKWSNSDSDLIVPVATN